MAYTYFVTLTFARILRTWVTHGLPLQGVDFGWHQLTAVVAEGSSILR